MLIPIPSSKHFHHGVYFTMLIPPKEVYIKVCNIDIVTISKMAIYNNVSTLIDQLNTGDRCWSFSSMNVGTCFTISIGDDLQENIILIKIIGEGYEKSFSIPTQLKKLISTQIFKKTIAEDLFPVIEYLGKTKHQKIKDREYHNFKVVKILKRNGEEVNNSGQQIGTTTTTTTTN